MPPQDKAATPAPTVEAAPVKDMAGKTVLITGGNSGIGYHTVHALLQRGARVILGCRSEERASQAVQRLKQEVPGADVEFELVDLCSLRSVQDFGDEILRQERRLDVLILNAGAMAADSRRHTREGTEWTLAANYLGHFHLTNILLPLLEKSAPSRIVVVSSAGHRFGSNPLQDLQVEKNYGKYRAYGQSKMCQILHCNELARRLKGRGVTANSLHPGVIATDFYKGQWYAPLAKWVLRTPKQGAQTSVYLATSEDVADVTGTFFSNCKPSTPHRNATDAEMAARLWTLSENLVQKAIRR